MTPSQAAVVGLTRRVGEVPPVETDDRRAWLVALTDRDLTIITREHGQGRRRVRHVLGLGRGR